MSNEFSTSEMKKKEQWELALATAFPAGIPQSAAWTDVNLMVNILKPFCAKGLCHIMLPHSAGGVQIETVACSKEPGCIELIDSGEMAYVCRPISLQFEHVSRSPWDSFFLLSTRELQPSGVYPEGAAPHEELLELPDGTYWNVDLLEEGSLGFDASDNEIPIPDGYRVTFRFFSGTFLMIAEQGLWNTDEGRYQRCYEGMTSVQIRRWIEAKLR